MASVAQTNSFTYTLCQCLLVLCVDKEETRRIKNWLLGITGMVCAPALLIGGLLTFGVPNAQIDGIMSTVFMAGWICSNIGMQRMQATGTGGWGRAVLLVQLTGLVLAFLFGFFETT